MEPGLLNRRVTLQKLVPVKDAGGGMSNSFVPQFTTWAKILPQSGAELESADQLDPHMQFLITIRYSKFRAPRPGWYVSYNGRMWRVRDVIDLEEAHLYIEMLCEEFETPGE